VYALVGPAAGLAGNALWLAFLLAAVAAGLTAYSYARLGAIRPKDAPEFQYTALAFGPRIGFMAGWLMLVADLLAVATVALGFGGYLGHLTGTSVAANATGLLVGTLLVLVAGIGQSVGLAIALTVVEAAGLLFVVAIGLPAWGRGTYLDMPHGVGGSRAQPPSFSSPTSGSTRSATSRRRCTTRRETFRERCSSRWRARPPCTCSSRSRQPRPSAGKR
jgi:APA family basic amino acid/polyamine antiporter